MKIFNRKIVQNLIKTIKVDVIKRENKTMKVGNLKIGTRKKKRKKLNNLIQGFSVFFLFFLLLFSYCQLLLFCFPLFVSFNYVYFYCFKKNKNQHVHKRCTLVPLRKTQKNSKTLFIKPTLPQAILIGTVVVYIMSTLGHRNKQNIQILIFAKLHSGQVGYHSKCITVFNATYGLMVC